MTERRAGGVLLHPTSLPGAVIGDLGDSARHFVDWLVDAGASFWQILPLVPADNHGSPYNALSAMAGNPLLVSVDLLTQEGLLRPGDVPAAPPYRVDRIDFAAASRWKQEILEAAFQRFRSGGDSGLAAEFDAFRAANEAWLPDYSLFRALRDYHQGASWTEWPRELGKRAAEPMKRCRALLAEQVEQHTFQQFLFDRQWRSLRGYAKQRGISIIGDLPIFVALNSADVWAHPELFQLDQDGAPTVVSGVPPDYFSATGQRWGNPLYRWDVLQARGYGWWIERFRRAFERADVVRIDHFRGFQAYWEIPAEEGTAVNGHWVLGPGAGFFHQVQRQLGPLPVVAEDLGIITDEVERLRDDLGFPGMRVLQFAFDGSDRNPHLPDNYPLACVAYTGTHDNDTLEGWWSTASPAERGRARSWLGEEHPEHWTFIEAVFRSPAQLAIVPYQDLLGLGSNARMNTPGQSESNWSWRMEGLPPPEVARRFRALAERAGRCGHHLDSEHDAEGAR